MTEPDEIEFLERVDTSHEARTGSPLMRSVPVRVGIVAGSAVLFVVGAVAAMGASPAPSGSATSPNSGSTPVAPFDGALPGVGPLGRGDFGLRGGDEFRIGGFRDITISAINGSNLSLKTDDGWTRTIAVGSSTTITRSGQTIALGDLKVGDQLVFRETKATDGSYTIDAIRVVLPALGGKVTAVGANSITVDQKGGGSATIHVSSTTTYDVNGNRSAKLSDVTVGSFVIAEGTLRSDGSLDATAVHGIEAGVRGPWFGPKFRTGPDGQSDPNAAPSATPSTSSSAS